MKNQKAQRKIAIACQGGGSHTAFTAGVLSHLALHWREEHRFVGISGTSGGGLCATLFWAAALQGDLEGAAPALKAFWDDNSAKSPWEATLNHMIGVAASLRGFVPTLETSPYQFPDWAGQQFRELLGRHFDFNHYESLKSPESPTLQLGAVEVIEGEFTVFDSSRQRMQLEMLQATAAIPSLFRAVEVQGKKYWDGLFSHNPPILSLLSAEPDEIWIIQVNPKRAQGEPKSVEEIEDRRNELSGNLSLEQEVAALDQINTFLETGSLQSSKCRFVKHRRISLNCPLKAASKLERSPSFITKLFEQGERAGAEFSGEIALAGQA